MYDSGVATTALGPGAPPGSTPRRTSDATARALCERRLALARAASSSMTMAPTLCRLPAYVGPGLPSPTISQLSVEAMVGTRSGPTGAVGSGLVVGELGLQRLGGDRRGDVDDQGLGVGHQLGTLGQGEVGRVDLRAGRDA